MGIVNVTPDSFSDGGAHAEFDRALAHARQMVADGVDIVDVGGESTRPGAQPVSESAERDRVLPLVEALVADGAIVSVDTSKPGVMRAALAAGAAMINDVRALRTPGALDVMAASDAAICLMHMQGDPRTMQADPRYRDVVAEVAAFLDQRVAACLQAGIARERVMIDPGIGFGKRLEHNLALLAHLDVLTSRHLPVLVGVSRKSMIGTLIGRSTNERLAGGVALAALAVNAGAVVIRAHDVAPTVDAVKVAAAVRAARRSEGRMTT
jgi:dihydropteroate synthase